MEEPVLILILILILMVVKRVHLLGHGPQHHENLPLLLPLASMALPPLQARDWMVKMKTKSGRCRRERLLCSPAHLHAMN